MTKNIASKQIIIYLSSYRIKWHYSSSRKYFISVWTIIVFILWYTNFFISWCRTEFICLHHVCEWCIFIFNLTTNPMFFHPFFLTSFLTVLVMLKWDNCYDTHIIIFGYHPEPSNYTPPSHYIYPCPYSTFIASTEFLWQKKNQYIIIISSINSLYTLMYLIKKQNVKMMIQWSVRGCEFISCGPFYHGSS